MISFSYCLDAFGNLIRLQLGQHHDALIPGAVEIATPAQELAYPLPWSLSIDDAVREIRFVPRTHVAGTVAERIHETGVIPQSPYVFVPRSIDFAKDEHVAEMIEIYDQLPVDHEGRRQIIEALEAVGVQQIPFISRFLPVLHNGTISGEITHYKAAGWISNQKVYRKAELP